MPGITGRRISIETASKVWNACGLRIGALVTDSEEMHTRAGCREEALLDLVRLNTQTLSELLSWLKHRPRCHDLKEG